MQKVILMGFVGKDPEEKFTSQGTKLTTFSLAVNSKENKEEVTQWYNINCWEETHASILFFIKKGSLITVIGDLKNPRVYQKKDGSHSVDMSVNCHSISFLPSKKSETEKKQENESIFDFGER